MPNLPRPKRYKYQPERKRKKREPTGDQQLYNSPVWRKLSKSLREQHPICKVALYAGEILKVDLVDHVIAIGFGGSTWSKLNLLPMSRKYHDIKSGLEAHGPFLRTISTPTGYAPEDVEQLFKRLTGLDQPIDFGL